MDDKAFFSLTHVSTNDLFAGTHYSLTGRIWPQPQTYVEGPMFQLGLPDS